MYKHPHRDKTVVRGGDGAQERGTHFRRVVEWCLRGVDSIASPYVDDILSGTEAQVSKLETLQAHERDIR